MTTPTRTPWPSPLGILGLFTLVAAALPAPAAAQQASPAAPTRSAQPAAPAGKVGGKLGGDIKIGKALTGLAIMRLRETQTLGRTEVADTDIRIQEDGKFDLHRRLTRYVKRDKGLERSLLRFTEPPNRGVAVLTIESADGDDDQWLYGPEVRKVKRVPRAEAVENFAGTGFAFEDLRSEDLDSHRYRTIGQVKVDDRPAYQIEATPIAGRIRANIGYSKRIIYVDAERWVELKTEYFDDKGELVKTQENSHWQQVADIYRPYRIRMIEHQKKRITWVKFRSWTANEPLDDDLFTTREMAREDH